MSGQLYRLEQVSKKYAGENLPVFENLDLDVDAGESLAIVGSSGSGKSTLLHLMGALDKPTSGKIFFAGKELGAMDQVAQAAFRNRSLGFVFQFHHLLPEFTALENVIIPGMIAGVSREAMLRTARELLERVGMSHKTDSRPTTLSGGERQRVAIARALVLKPKVVLADEPTGNLDEHTGKQVGDLLLNINREMGTTLVVVTHNRELAASMDRGLELRGGALYEKAFTSD